MALSNEPTINIVPSDGGVTFEFHNNKHYLTNGTITVPLNSLALITDESEMFTFRKANTNDIFLSAKYEDVGLSRAELQQLYEESFVGAGINMDDIDEEIDFMTADLVDNAVYDSASHSLVFYHGEDELFTIDAAPFIKDGMVSSVAVSGGNLVVTFNTDAGKQPISIPLTEIFDPSLYYTKAETDAAFSQAMDALNTFTAQTQAALATKADTATTYTKSQTDALLDEKADQADIDAQMEVIATSLNELKDDKLDVSAYTPTDLSDYYTKAETDAAFNNAMGQLNTFTAQTQTALATKADTATTYTKTEVDDLLDDKLDATAYTPVDLSEYAKVDDVNDSLEVAARAMFQLKEEKLDVSAYTPTDLSNYYTKAQTDEAFNNAIGQLNTFSAQTQTALATKADTATTYTKTEVDDLLDDKLDVTAYTPVDTSSFATKAELASKQDVLTAGSGITIENNVISADGGGSITVDSAVTSGSTNAVESAGIYNFGKQFATGSLHLYPNGSTSVNYLTSKFGGSSSSNDFMELRDGLYSSGGQSWSDTFYLYLNLDNNSKFTALKNQLGGISLVKLTQAEYDALQTKDQNTLFIITDAV